MDIAHIAQVSNLDREHVARVCAKLNHDSDAISHALDQFFSGMGAFLEGQHEHGWVERKKDKTKKSEDDMSNVSIAKRCLKGDGKGSGMKSDARGKGSEGRARGDGSRKGRGREAPQIGSLRLERSLQEERTKTVAHEATSNGTTVYWDPPGESGTGTKFVTTKGPIVSAWSQTKDWAAIAAPVEQAFVQGAIKPATVTAHNHSIDITLSPSPRNGRGRTSARDRVAKHRDAESPGDVAISRGRGKSRRDGRPVTESTATEIVLTQESENPNLTVYGAMSSALLPSDPAIMTVGSALLGPSTPGLGASDSTQPLSPQSKPLFSTFDGIVPTTSLDSICQRSVSDVCSLSTPVSLPLPASLVTALPGAAGASPLPGFGASADVAATEHFTGGLEQLSLGSKLLSSSSTVDSLASGKLPSCVVAPATGLAPLSNLPSGDGISIVASSSLAPKPQTLSDVSRGHSGSAQMANATPPIIHVPAPLASMQPSTAGLSTLETMCCTASGQCGALDDMRVNPLVPSLVPTPAMHMETYGVAPVCLSNDHDALLQAPAPPVVGRHINEKEGRSRPPRNNKKRSGAREANNGGVFNGMPLDSLGMGGSPGGMIPPGLPTNGGVMAVQMGGEMPSSASQSAASMLPPQQFAAPPSGLPQYFLPPMAPTMANYGCYASPIGMGGTCAYAPPAGIGGMYQQTQPNSMANLYQPPQYAQQQPPQQYVPQPPHVSQQPQFVPPAQQAFGMPQQSGAGPGYAYQTPMGAVGRASTGGAMAGTGGGGGFPGGGFSGGSVGGQLYNNGPHFSGYDDNESYSGQPGNMYGTPGYYRSS